MVWEVWMVGCVGHLDAEAAEIRKNALVAPVAPVENAFEERLETRIARINPETQQVKLVKPLAGFDRELDAGDPSTRGTGILPVQPRQELLHPVAIVMVRKRHRRKPRPLLRQLRGGERSVACGGMDVEIDEHGDWGLGIGDGR